MAQSSMSFDLAWGSRDTLHEGEKNVLISSIKTERWWDTAPLCVLEAHGYARALEHTYREEGKNIYDYRNVSRE